MKKKIKAVLFDRDGTLLPSEDVYMKSITEAFRDQDIELTDEDRAFFVAKAPRQCFPELFKKYTFDPDRIEEVEKFHYDKMMEGVGFSEEVIDLILEVKKTYRIGLVTTSEPDTTFSVIKNSNFDGQFEVVITGNMFENKKPHPQPYLEAAKVLGLDPSECIVFEDSQTGVESAKSAGMICYAIPNEHTRNHDFSKADGILSHLDDIKTLLKRF